LAFTFLHCELFHQISTTFSQLISQGSIPTEIGKLKNLIYLRLSYNAFTGAAPEGLGEMKGLQLLQLQSNRITELPNIPRLNDIHGKSTFVTDCGVPSAFDKALKCEYCTMCCEYYSFVAHFDSFPLQPLTTFH
jgi:hypothetical protein